MKIKDSMMLSINDHDISVVFTDPGLWNQNAFGKAFAAEQKIEINNMIPVDLQQSTFLHELIHIILDLGSIELPEETIDCIAFGFMSFIRNNPDMVKWITDRGKERAR